MTTPTEIERAFSAILVRMENSITSLTNRVTELEARVKELEDHPLEKCTCTKCTG